MSLLLGNTIAAMKRIWIVIIKCNETEFFDRQQSSHPVEVICATWNDYSVDFVHLKPVFHTAVVEEGQRRVLKEYLKALLTKLVTYSKLKKC